jgi:hypothetical protein
MIQTYLANRTEVEDEEEVAEEEALEPEVEEEEEIPDSVIAFRGRVKEGEYQRFAVRNGKARDWFEKIWPDFTKDPGYERIGKLDGLVYERPPEEVRNYETMKEVKRMVKD